jgi:endoglucanase
MRVVIAAILVLLLLPAAYAVSAGGAEPFQPGDRVTYVAGGLQRTGTVLVVAGSTALVSRNGAESTQYTLPTSRLTLVSPPPTPTPTPTPTATPTPTPTPDPSPGGRLRVAGQNLVDGSGARVFLHGTNYSGPEYACIQGWGIFDGPGNDALAAAIRSWNFNVVHVGLNESCVLGINGVPAQYAGANYLRAIKDFVGRVHAHGMYAHVSLMWAAPGGQRPSGHPPILNRDHSVDALKAIANTFKDDPMTMIGLQSEPHDITWQCWRDGGSACSVGYAALGMQEALDAVRSTGATNVVTVSGIDWANNLSEWLTWRPTDPLGQLVAEAHVYGGNWCSSAACFDRDYAPVAAQVPLIFGETGETYDASSCGSANSQRFMAWNEANADGYESWTWNTWGNCSSLISSFAGTVYPSAYARFVRDHNLGLSP